MEKPVRVEYKCTYCGKTTPPRLSTQGRPEPGVCTRKGKTKDGQTKPHSWVINRKW